MARPQLLKRRLRRNLGYATLCFFVLSLCASASAQLELTTRLTPWPPAGWPEGVQGEVRAVTVEDITLEEFEPADLQSVFSFPVSETGEVTYRLPEALPRRARRFYQEVSLDDLQLCPEVAPSLSPPGAQMVLLNFALYSVAFTVELLYDKYSRSATQYHSDKAFATIPQENFQEK